MEEHFFQCPYCWEEISMLLDPSSNSSYVEDCEVCCNPIRVTAKFDNTTLTVFRVESLEQ